MKRCAKCGKEMNDNAKFCTGCGNKFPVSEPTDVQGVVCPKCWNSVKPGAKFCTKCGNRMVAAETAMSVSENVCPKCWNSVKPGTKFCTKCGNRMAELAPVGNTPKKDFSLIGSMIHWNVLPGQIAVKIDENDIATYGKAVKGVNIQNGVRALFFLQGKLIAELDAGTYSFKELGTSDFTPEKVAEKPEEKSIPQAKVMEKKGLFTNFLNNISNFFTGTDRVQAEAAGLTTRISTNVPPVSMVLVRATAIPLIFNFENVRTANIPSNIGLHVLCKISDINEFYANLLLDAKMICFEELCKELQPYIQSTVKQLIAGVSAEKIDNNQELQDQMFAGIQGLMPGVYPFIAVERIVNLTSVNEDIDNLHKLGDELYIAEQELQQAARRNEFLNRLQNAKNEQELAEMQSGNVYKLTTAQIESRQTAAMNKIAEEMALTADEKAKFELMLSAQRMLREAKSDSELAAAMQEFEKSGMLRQKEMENLRHQIAHGAKLQELTDDQIINMTTVQNQQALDQQKADWEMMMGNRKLENELNQMRIQDAYTNERRDADAQYEDSRKRAQIDLDRQEQQNELDMLKQAQAIREERDAAEHRRDMEAMTAARQFDMQADKQKLDATNEEKRIYAGMSFEQIMAANPNISEHAARSLAEKFKSDNAVQAANDKAQMAQNMQNQMTDFMKQMMQMNNQQNMTQMQMMRDVATANAGADQRANQKLMDAKQQELEHVRADASANSDRFVDGMKTTINAVAAMPHVVPVQPLSPAGGRSERKNAAPVQVQGQEAVPAPEPSPASAGAPAEKTCPHCQAKLEDSKAPFCGECGQKL